MTKAPQTEETKFGLKKQSERTLRKKHELALLLPVLGLVLYFSPLIDAFTNSDTGSNILHLIFYIFGSWALLIFCTYLLNRYLKHEVHKD